MKRIAALCLLCLAVAQAWAFKAETITLKTALVPAPDMEVNVLVPDAADTANRCPVVYLLNGFSGDQNSWHTHVRPDLGELADLYGMIIVMPDGRDSWYWDSPAHPEMKMETFIIDELVPAIDSRFPTLPEPAKRAITGLSMGGQGAMWLAMRHPGVFGSVGSTSGGLDIRPFPRNWKMPQWLGEQAQYPKRWEDHTLPNLVQSLKPGELNIIFDCGADDFFAKVNADMHAALLDAGIPHDYISRPGNHNPAYWRNAILYQLLFFNEVFNR